MCRVRAKRERRSGFRTRSRLARVPSALGWKRMPTCFAAWMVSFNSVHPPPQSDSIPTPSISGFGSGTPGSRVSATRRRSAPATSLGSCTPSEWQGGRAFGSAPASLGYDMWSDPIRRAAMERSRDTGEAILSGKVPLVQEIDLQRQSGVLLYLAIYRPGSPHRTLAQRRSALLGFAYCPFRTQDLFEGIFRDQRDPLVELSVYDGRRPDAANLLYTSRPGGAGPPDAPLEFFGESEMMVGLRPWLVLFTPSARSASAGLDTVLV